MAAVVPQVNPNSPNPIGPFRNAATITPSDTAELSPLPNAVYVGTSGTLVYVPAAASGSSPAAVEITLSGISGGSILPISPQMVMSGGTTAGGLVGLW